MPQLSLRNPVQAQGPGATHLQGMMATTGGLRLVPREGLAGSGAARPPQPLADAAPQVVGAGSQAAVLQARGNRRRGPRSAVGRGHPASVSPEKGQDSPWLPAGHTSPSCCPSAFACWRSTCPSPPGGRRGSPRGRTSRGRGSSPAGEAGWPQAASAGGTVPSPPRGDGPTVAPNTCKGRRATSRSRRTPSGSVCRAGVRTPRASQNRCFPASQIPQRLEGPGSCRKSLMSYVPGPSLSFCGRKAARVRTGLGKGAQRGDKTQLLPGVCASSLSHCTGNGAADPARSPSLLWPSRRSMLSPATRSRSAGVSSAGTGARGSASRGSAAG